MTKNIPSAFFTRLSCALTRVIILVLLSHYTAMSEKVHATTPKGIVGGFEFTQFFEEI